MRPVCDGAVIVLMPWFVVVACARSCAVGARWERWLHAAPEQQRQQVLPLVSAIRNASHAALNCKLQWFLHLFRLREVLLTFEGTPARRHHVQRSRSRLFAAFLAHSYGDKAHHYNLKLQRLSNWFRLPQVDGQPVAAAAHFFVSLCTRPQLQAPAEEMPAGAEAAVAAVTHTHEALPVNMQGEELERVAAAAAPAAVAPRLHHHAAAACVTFAHFLALAPKLGDIQARCMESEQQTASAADVQHASVDRVFQQQLGFYLHLTPVARMEAVLEEHFPSAVKVSCPPAMRMHHLLVLGMQYARSSVLIASASIVSILDGSRLQQEQRQHDGAGYPPQSEAVSLGDHTREQMEVTVMVQANGHAHARPHAQADAQADAQASDQLLMPASERVEAQAHDRASPDALMPSTQQAQELLLVGSYVSKAPSIPASPQSTAAAPPSAATTQGPSSATSPHSADVEEGVSEPMDMQDAAGSRSVVNDPFLAMPPDDAGPRHGSAHSELSTEARALQALAARAEVAPALPEPAAGRTRSRTGDGGQDEVSLPANKKRKLMPPIGLPSHRSTSALFGKAASAFLKQRTGSRKPAAASRKKKQAAKKAALQRRIAVSRAARKAKQALVRASQLQTTAATPSTPPSMHPQDSLPQHSDEAIRPLAFAHPLEHCLPYHPRVQAHLAKHGIAVVEPCFRDHAAVIKELDIDLLQHGAFRRAYRMSLSCVNDGSSKQVAYPQLPSSSSDVYPSPACTADEVFAFLEQQWAHMSTADGSAPLPRHPPTEKCLYLKDLSIFDIKRGSGERNKISFLPRFAAQLHAMQDAVASPQMDEDSSTPMEEEPGAESHDEGGAQPGTFHHGAATVSAVASTGSSARSSDSGDGSEGVPSVRHYLVHPLFLDEYAHHADSLLRLSSQQIDGVHTAYAYLKFSFQFFNLHIEQLLLPFVHHQLSGESTWILIPHDERHKLRVLIQEMARTQVAWLRRSQAQQTNNEGTTIGEGPATNEHDINLLSDTLLYSKSLFPPLSLLSKHSIRHHRVQLNAGQVLVAHGGFAHCGFSTGAGETHAFACNIMTEQWLVSGGPQFVLHYLEWIWQLSQDVPAEAIDQALAAMGLSLHHLGNAFNACPPAYTCDLLTALQADLRWYVNNHGPSTASAAPRYQYTITIPQAQAALSAIHACLVLLHRAEVRVLLRKYYVVQGDAHLQLCKCASVGETTAAVTTASATPTNDLLRRLSNCILQTTSLVSTSGELLEESMERLRSKAEQARAAAAPAMPVTAAVDHPVSFTYGCITPAACAKMIAVLEGEERIPRSLRLSGHSRFLDIGSGVGQVVLQVQLRCQVATATGIEVKRDRHQAAESLLQELRSGTLPNASLLEALRPYLDERLDRIRFIHGQIENEPQLLEDATHVFLFDAHFHPDAHEFLVPRLCSGRARVVVTCLSAHEIEARWPALNRFELVGQLDLSMSGSGSTRQGYVYVTGPA